MNTPKYMDEMTPWITNPEQKPGTIINDVTLRDGKQALAWYNVPSASESAQFVSRLADAGVHHVEVGFSAIKDDPETRCVERIVQENKDRDIMIFALSRLVASDIDMAISTLAPAKYKGIHTFVGISEEHLASRGFTHKKVIEMVRNGVSRIVDAGYMCQFSGEDMARAILQNTQENMDTNFVDDVYATAVESGAKILNHPDTLGICRPSQYSSVIQDMAKRFPNQVHSTHTHNDMSSAEANTIEGVIQGSARRIEGTICGIGERAGNADWMSVVISMISASKENWGDSYHPHVRNILAHPEKIQKIYEHFRKMTGIHSRPVAPGYGYFSQVNRSGIHQKEVAKLKSAYLWTKPHIFGFDPFPTIDINPLSGGGGVLALCDECGLDRLEGEELWQFSALVRDIFSPDTNPHDIIGRFSYMSGDSVKAIADKVYRVRQEARNIQVTPEKEQEWMHATREIFMDAYGFFVGSER